MTEAVDVPPPPATGSGAVADLLGVLAYGELTAFMRLAADADLAPTLQDKAALARMATGEFAHFELVVDRLRALGLDPDAAMSPFVEPFERFHERTAPSTWLESLVKAYVGDGIAADFYREIGGFVGGDLQTLIVEVLADADTAEFAVHTVRAAIDADPAIAGRLALWGRRLVAEALSQAQQVAADRDGLTELLVGTADRPGADLAQLVQMFARITQEHQRRMATLGLAP